VNSFKKISGRVVYKDLEGGFWGIEADDNYLPIDFPEQLKYRGADVTCIVDADIDVMSFISWGIPCSVISFSTIQAK